MELTVEDLGHGCCLRLAGRLDSPGVDVVGTRFLAAANQGRGAVLVDHSSVSFVSSMGIRMLMAAAKTLHARNLRLVVFGARPLVRELFDTVALDQILPLAADESEALQMAARP